ncbi:MAG TPA: LuxR C-terminal-related transcriptional regulator [Bacteroidia bacterium]|nr:LuxR C-terminal-related transcriptional regulator [Bacteroidia bacterium]
MLLPGTQMHVITFLFICIETVILLYLVIYRLARPDDKSTLLNIILILLLILYNATGGLLPDADLPGSYFVQTSTAYATGFITPCYFPYYVYNSFALEKMKFHAYRGVILFLILPYVLFVIIFVSSGNLDTAKNLLVIPVGYALWVIITLIGAVKFKYHNNFRPRVAKEEIAVLFLSLTPWVGLPVIDYFNWGQPVEATTTNTGFLLLLALQLKQHIVRLREEHERLIDSEEKLLKWNEQLQEEVEKRTQELEKLSREERLSQNCKKFRLTTREIEIALLVYKGYSHKQIGEILFIAERTVAKHVQNIFEKAQVSNRLELSRKLDMV